jgi:hypothetical protein
LSAALGTPLEEAISGLRKAAVGGEGYTKEDQAALARSLNELISRGAGVADIAGGSELATISERRSKALGLAQVRDVTEIEKQYGLGTGVLRKQLGLAEGAEATPEQLTEAVMGLAREELVGQLGSGAGGGIFRRGESIEAQTMLNLEQLSRSVTTMAQTVDAVHSKVTGEDPVVTDITGGSKKFFGVIPVPWN